MNCVFEITLNRPLDANECVGYTGHFCEFCDEDNGGGKFCYNCGKRESKDYGRDDDDILYDSLISMEKEPVEEEFDYEALMWKMKGVEVCGDKFLKFGVSYNVYRFKEFIELNMNAEIVGKWNVSKNKVDFYDDFEEQYYYDNDSDSDDE